MITAISAFKPLHFKQQLFPQPTADATYDDIENVQFFDRLRFTSFNRFQYAHRFDTEAT